MTINLDNDDVLTPTALSAWEKVESKLQLKGYEDVILAALKHTYKAGYVLGRLEGSQDLAAEILRKIREEGQQVPSELEDLVKLMTEGGTHAEA